MTGFRGTWASRTVALALLIGIAAAIYSLIVDPLMRAYRETDAAIAQASISLARYEAIAGSGSQFEAQLDRLEQHQARSGIYLTGATDALAAAKLQEKVSATIQEIGGNLRSIQILPVESDGDFRRVAVRVRINARIEPLFRILYSLEAGEALLFINNLDIKADRRRRRDKGNPDDPTLSVRFDLFGYLKPEVT